MSIALIATGAKDAEMRSLSVPVLGSIEMYPVPVTQAVIAATVLLLPDGGGKSVSVLGLLIAIAAMYVTFAGSQPIHVFGSVSTYVVPLVSVFQALVVVTLTLSPNLAYQRSGRRASRNKTQ